MSDIQRYSGDWSWGYVADGDPYAGLYESAGGELVKYADHVAVVAAARAEERQRINSVLVVDYVREQYERGAADKAAELQDHYGEQAQGHYNDGYKMGYAKGLIEGDSGGRKEGYRAGYAAGKDAVMTSSYEQAVAEGEREALSKWIDGVAKGRADAAKEVAELDLASCESMIEHVSRFAAVNAARGPISEQRCVHCGDAITDWGYGDWHHVPSTDPPDTYLEGHDHDARVAAIDALKKP